MQWKKLVQREMESEYRILFNLYSLIDDSMLGWKPSEKNNWMTVGQLLMHLSNSCGASFNGFITGNWGIPEEAMKDMSPDEMLPPAEKLPTVKSIHEATEMLKEDEKLARKLLAEVDEQRLETEDSPVMWDPNVVVLGYRLLQSVQHTQIHKAQLFYYLKLMGKPVNTSHLWGM